ncbi:hypothetical protein [Acuticoccus sediminis]|uniref:hypothetical protein n=1 Tax=Acuticoccus sediminis TaxID=2184697 RepID=UPI001CFDFBBF|nr:hypothetical protein [Acuticoccus sediminis]
MTASVRDKAIRFLRSRAEKGCTAPLALIASKLEDATTTRDDVRRALRDLEREGLVSSIRRGGRGRLDRAVVYQLGGAA